MRPFGYPLHTALLLSVLSVVSACAPKEPPLPPITIPALGAANAPLVVEQYSDYQCAPCAQASWRLQKLVEGRYRGKVQLVYRNRPIPGHHFARSAARAAIAAAAQDKFWEMHDGLFKNQKEIGPRLYSKLAYDIGLDVAQFEADMKHSRVQRRLFEDEQSARALGIDATPTVIIGTMRLRGLQTEAVYQNAIDKALKQKGS